MRQLLHPLDPNLKYFSDCFWVWVSNTDNWLKLVPPAPVRGESLLTLLHFENIWSYWHHLETFTGIMFTLSSVAMFTCACLDLSLSPKHQRELFSPVLSSLWSRSWPVYNLEPTLTRQTEISMNAHQSTVVAQEQLQTQLSHLVREDENSAVCHHGSMQDIPAGEIVPIVP